MLDSKTWKPAVVMKRCEEPRSFIVKTENGKTFSNCQHLHQIAGSNGTDDTVLIFDGGEENSKEREVNVKCEEVEMDPHNEVKVPHADNLSNEVTIQSGQVSRRPIWYNDYVH